MSPISPLTLGPIAAWTYKDRSILCAGFSGEVKRASHWTEVGVLHYVKLNDLVQVNSPQSIALTCRKCPSMYVNGRHNISSEIKYTCILSLPLPSLSTTL